MIRPLLVTADDGLATRVSQAAGGATVARLDLRSLPRTAQDLLAVRATEGANVFILDGTGDDAAALALARELDTRGLAVIVVSDSAAELALQALRAGVEDLLDRGASVPEIRVALDRAVQSLAAPGMQAQAARNFEGRGTVVSVVSPKGGVGKTTVASNLAVGLAGREGNTAVLVDLDIHFGDVATALNLSHEFALPDVTTGPGARDSIAVKSYLTQHETGLYVIPGSESPAAADAVTAADVTRLLEVLRDQFEFVIVDTAPGFSDHALAALDVTDVLVMVTSLDVPGVRGLRKEIDTLAELGLFPSSRHIVLNFFESSRGLSVADVEASIGVGIDVVIPVAKAVPLSVNQGIPLLQSGGRDPASKQLRALVDRVSPAGPEPKRGLFGRRFA